MQKNHTLHHFAAFACICSLVFATATTTIAVPVPITGPGLDWLFRHGYPPAPFFFTAVGRQIPTDAEAQEDKNSPALSGASCRAWQLRSGARTNATTKGQMRFSLLDAYQPTRQSVVASLANLFAVILMEVAQTALLTAVKQSPLPHQISRPPQPRRHPRMKPYSDFRGNRRYDRSNRRQHRRHSL